MRRGDESSSRRCGGLHCCSQLFSQSICISTVREYCSKSVVCTFMRVKLLLEKMAAAEQPRETVLSLTDIIAADAQRQRMWKSDFEDFGWSPTCLSVSLLFVTAGNNPLNSRELKEMSTSLKSFRERLDLLGVRLLLLPVYRHSASPK